MKNLKKESFFFDLDPNSKFYFQVNIDEKI